MTDLEADPCVKVVMFHSANPIFIAHLDLSKSAERPGVLDPWRDSVLRLFFRASRQRRQDSRPRAASVTSSFWPATCASPGGKAPGSARPRSASDWSRGRSAGMAAALGRSFAPTIPMLDIAERGGWVNRTLDDDELGPFVDALVRRRGESPDQSLPDADSYRASVEQRPVPSNLDLAQCPGALRQDPWHRLRGSERLRIELRPVRPCARAGERR